MYLKDVVKEDYKLWRVGDEIFINAMTGTGKTSFVLDVLVEEAITRNEEILYLTNRKISLAQIKQKLGELQGIKSYDAQEISDFLGICVKTYQSLELQILERGISQVVYELKRFRWIVFDEAHYFMQDSLFNSRIQAWDNFWGRVSSSVKIFMSATLEEVKECLVKYLHGGKISEPEATWLSPAVKAQFTRACGISIGYLWEYDLTNQLPKMSVRYFTELEEIAKIINADESDKKWMIFVSNKRKGEKLLNTLECSKTYLDADMEAKENVTLKKIISDEKFDEKVLVCT